MKTKPAARSRFDAACWVLNASPPVRPIRHPRFTPLVPLLLLLAAFNVSTATLHAQIIFDATADFNITNGNPNGAWSYGWMPTDFSQFSLCAVSENRWQGPAWVACLAVNRSSGKTPLRV